VLVRRTYFKLPGDHVALIRLDMQQLTTAIGTWLETVKVRWAGKSWWANTVAMDLLHGQRAKSTLQEDTPCCIQARNIHYCV